MGGMTTHHGIPGTARGWKKELRRMWGPEDLNLRLPASRL
jgi:hypothetical protein